MTDVVSESAAIMRRSNGQATSPISTDVLTVVDSGPISPAAEFDALWREFVRASVRLRLFESLFANVHINDTSTAEVIAELERSLGDGLLAQVSRLADAEPHSPSFHKLIKRLEIASEPQRQALEDSLANLDSVCVAITGHRDRRLLANDASPSVEDVARLCCDVKAALQAMRPLIEALNVVFGTHNDTALQGDSAISQQARSVARQLRLQTTNARKNVFGF